MKNLRTQSAAAQSAAALFLTPAILLAACSTTNDTRSASARRSNPDNAATTDRSQNPTQNDRNEARMDRSETDRTVNATPNNTNPSAANSTVATQSSSSTTSAWGPNGSGHWGPQSGMYSSYSSSNSDQVNWQAQQNNAAQNRSANQTSSRTNDGQLAANRAISDPSTNPTNANAQQIGSDRNTPSTQSAQNTSSQTSNAQNRAWSDRPASDVGASGQNRPADAAAANVSADSRILSILHVKNQYEIEAGRLAQSRSSNSQVQQYGAMLVTAHTDADAKVVKVASQANAKLLSKEETRQLMHADKGQNASTPNTQKDPLDELRSLNGAEFDRVFAQKMVEGHAKLATMIEQAQPKVQNPQVSRLLAELLPIVRQHEQEARNLPGFSESPTQSGAPGHSMNK